MAFNFSFSADVWSFCPKSLKSSRTCVSKANAFATETSNRNQSGIQYAMAADGGMTFNGIQYPSHLQQQFKNLQLFN